MRRVGKGPLTIVDRAAHVIAIRASALPADDVAREALLGLARILNDFVAVHRLARYHWRRRYLVAREVEGGVRRSPASGMTRP